MQERFDLQGCDTAELEGSLFAAWGLFGLVWFRIDLSIKNGLRSGNVRQSVCKHQTLPGVTRAQLSSPWPPGRSLAICCEVGEGTVS